ncbi:MAG: hypothetical protein KDA21_04205 [Phycisphaerales bacterium]|nr:hypothetical protein [Phycisphaerales bacterium]
MSGIENPELRDIAKRALSNIRESIVIRPAVTEWPGDDEPPWIEEARGARSVEELTDILCSLATTNHAELEVSPLTSVTEPGYWRGSRQSLTPTGTMAEQAALLRPILVHSPTLILSLPYGNLRNFAWELIESAFKRPQGFPMPSVHIYNETPGGDPEKTLGYFRTRYPDIARTGRVHWHFWPSNRECYRERVLLGSIERKPLNGETVPGARWGVAMTHCPGEGDDNSASTTWSLQSRTGLLQHQDRLNNAIREHGITSFTL